MTQYNERKSFTSIYSYAIPTKEAVSSIIDFAQGSRILEVGSGRALWAYLINQMAHADMCIPTDCATRSNNMYENLRGGTTYMEVEVVQAETAIELHPECDTLLSIWPSYAQDWIGDTLKAFNGSRFVYVGEEMGGCTGGDNLFEELGKNWECANSIGIPQWWGIHDEVCLYRRKAV